VKSGYWPLYRYNPQLAKEGKNGFILDFQEAGRQPQAVPGGRDPLRVAEEDLPGRRPSACTPC